MRETKPSSQRSVVDVRVSCGAAFACVALCVLVGLAGCASAGPTQAKSPRALDAKAVKVCTVSGSTPLPLKGSERVVGAENSSIASAEKIVGFEYRDEFNQLVSGMDPKTYVALCFDQIDPRTPANGRLVVAQFENAAGSTFIGTW